MQLLLQLPVRVIVPESVPSDVTLHTGVMVSVKLPVWALEYVVASTVYVPDESVRTICELEPLPSSSSDSITDPEVPLPCSR